MTQLVLQTTTPYRHISKHFGCEKGSVLFVGITLLFILTLIGITSMRTTTQQEKMSGNLRDRTIAFQGAEAALAAAEKTYFSPSSTQKLTSNGTFTGSACTSGDFLQYCPCATGDTGTCAGSTKLCAGTACCTGATTKPAPYLVAYGRGDGANPTFWKSTYASYWASCGQTTGIVFVDSTNYGKPGYPSKSPLYVIEQLSNPADPAAVESYRVTAIGYGFTDLAVVVLQATYSTK